MSISSRFAKSFFFDAIIFAVFFVIITNVPAFKAIDMQIHGWGWVLLILFAIGFTVIQGFLAGVCKGILGSFGLRPTRDFSLLVDGTFDWVGNGLALIVVATYFPTLASYTSGVTLLFAAGLIGLCSGCCDVVRAHVYNKN